MTDYLTPRANPYLPDLPDVNSIAALLQQPTQSRSGALYAQASAPASSSDSGSGTLALLSAIQGQKQSAVGRRNKHKGMGGGGAGKTTNVGIKGLPNSMNNSVAENRKIAQTVMAKKYPQWTHADMTALIKLWNRESGWNAKADNPTSSAAGIAQRMMSAHPGKLGGPIEQILWGEKYIRSRYGDPQGAWAHSQRTGWY